MDWTFWNFESLNSYFESFNSYFERLNSYFESLNSYFGGRGSIRNEMIIPDDD